MNRPVNRAPAAHGASPARPPAGRERPGRTAAAAALLGCCLIVFSHGAARAQPAALEVFHPPEPHHARNAGPVQEKDLWYEETDRRPYSECWYYLAVAEDGTVFFCHFNLVTVNFLVRQYALDYNLYLPDGTRHFFADSYDRKDADWATDRFHVKLGRNRISGTLERQQLTIEEDGYALDLRFTPGVAALRDGTGRIYLGPQKKDYLDITYQPDLKVEGTLRHGGRVVPIVGWGYGDHVRQTFIPTDFAKVLYAFRAKLGDLFVTALEYHPEPRYTPRRVPSLIVTHRDRLVMVSHGYSLEPTALHRDDLRRTEVPRSFRIQDRAEGFDLECTAEGALFKRVDLLASVGSFQKKVLELLGIRSYSYVFDEQTRCTVRSPEVSGTFEGRGVFEALVSD